jgi:hypothetical protein
MVWTPAQTKSKLFLPGTNHVKYIEKKQQFMESFLTSLRIEHYEENENVSHQSDAGNSQQHHSLHQEGDVVQPRCFFLNLTFWISERFVHIYNINNNIKS